MFRRGLTEALSVVCGLLVNGIGDAGAEALCESFVQLSQLRHVSLMGTAVRLTHSTPSPTRSRFCVLVTLL